MNNKVNAVGRVLSEAQCAYLAGFFDADGAIMAMIEKHLGKKFKFRVRLVIKLTQKKKDLLVQIKAEIGYGHIRLNRGVYEYDIKDQNNVVDFINLVYPYTRTKKPQLDIALKIHHKMVSSGSDLVELAHLADTLSGFNVRSKSRRKNYAAMVEEFLLPVTTEGK